MPREDDDVHLWRWTGEDPAGLLNTMRSPDAPSRADGDAHLESDAQHADAVRLAVAQLNRVVRAATDAGLLVNLQLLSILSSHTRDGMPLINVHVSRVTDL